MNALSMTIGPMIFISVIAGITHMSNATDVGRIGGKLIMLSLVKLFVCTVLGVVFGLLFFSDGLSGLAAAVPRQDMDVKPGLSLLDMITGLLPEMCFRCCFWPAFSVSLSTGQGNGPT